MSYKTLFKKQYFHEAFLQIAQVSEGVANLCVENSHIPQHTINGDTQ